MSKVLSIFRNTFLITLIFFTQSCELRKSEVSVAFLDSGAIGACNGFPFQNSEDISAGTLSNPLEICSLNQLNQIRNYLNSHFKLMNNINASATSSWGSYIDPDATPGNGDEYFEGFSPIGVCLLNDCTDADVAIFTGSFDGNGKTIFDLYINRPNQFHIGLFASTCIRSGVWTCSSAASFIKDLTLKDVSIKGKRIGSVVSIAGSTTLTNLHVTGVISGASVGGVTYDSYGDVNGAVVDLSITSTLNPSGGIVAIQRTGSMRNCKTSGNLISSGGDSGGVIGYTNTSAIVDSCQNGMNITSGSGAGGIIGGKSGAAIIKISNSFNTGSITSAAGERIGGIAGSATNTVLINVFSTGNISGRKNVGGIYGAGDSSTVLKNCFSSGAITGSTAANYSAIGGLVGANVSILENCYWSGSSVIGKHNVGGVVGWS